MKTLKYISFLAIALIHFSVSAQQINITGWSDIRNMQNPCDSVSIQIAGDMDATYAQGPVNVSVSGFTISVEVIMIYGFATQPVSPNIPWYVEAQLGYLPKGNYTLNVTSKLSTVQYDFKTYSFSVDHNYTFLRDSAICHGDSIRIGQSILGMSNPSYSWSNGKSTQKIYISTSGSYIVSATGSNCSVTDTMELSVTAPIMDILQDSGSTVCIGDSLVLGGGPSYYSYKWSDKSTADTVLWVFVSAGNETIGLMVTDSNACSSEETVEFIVEDCDTVQIGIEDVRRNDVSFSLYPNPASNQVTISLLNDHSLGEKKLIITDMKGQVAYEGRIIKESTIQTTSFPTGIYVVYLIEKEKHHVQRMSVMH